MINEVRVLLGDASERFSDAQISLALKLSLAEITSYCNRSIDYELQLVAERLAIIKLNRANTEGLASQSYSGVSENYLDGYPADIKAILNRKRKVKVV